VAFDDNGDRIYAGYDVINIREQQKKHVVGKFSYDSVSSLLIIIYAVARNLLKSDLYTKCVLNLNLSGRLGYWNFFLFYQIETHLNFFQMRAKMRMRINDSEIIWPGKQRRKPEGIMIPTHLKLLTIEEKPFVYVRRMGDDEFRCEPDERPCPLFNNSDATGG